jgi:hypothetical protein
MPENATKTQGKVKGRGRNPNSRKNLDKGKWAKGQSGNPKGMEPGTRHRRTTLEKWAFVEIEMVNPITKEKESGTIDDEVHLAWLRECRKGNMTAVKEYLDTLHGKIADKTEHTGKDGKDLIPQKFIVEIVQNDGDSGSDKN